MKRAGIVRNHDQLLLIQKTTTFNLSSTGVVNFQMIQPFILTEMWEETTPNYLIFFFLLEVSFWTFLNPPTPPKSVKRDVSPSLKNFYFGSAIRHESKFVHRYTPARKEEL